MPKPINILRRALAAISGSALALLTLAPAAAAQDIYYSATLEDVGLEKVTEEQPATLPDGLPRSEWTALTPPMQLDFVGEAYLAAWDRWPASNRARLMSRSTLVVRAAVGAEIGGVLFLPREDSKGFEAYRFTLPASAKPDATARKFLRVKSAHYGLLANADIPGGAWFRALAETAWTQSEALSWTEGEDRVNQVGPPAWRDRLSEVDDTYELFTGGRALAENLQLDRELAGDGVGTRDIAVDSLSGIEVEELDWTERIAELHPSVDPLAEWIPADRHAVFFPSTASFKAVLDELTRYGTPILRTLEPRAEDARTRERYERQMGFEIDALAAQFDSDAIHGIALTGSDPYFRTGTDVALLFDCSASGAEALQAYLAKGRQATEQGAGFSAGTTGRPFFARRGNVLLLANSQQLLLRLTETQEGRRPSLQDAPEYTFFRDRYPRDGADQSAFLILTDATIRRWASPRWRIAAARRVQAASRMSIALAKAIQDGGKREVTSEEYGDLAFLTPIVDLQVDLVTEAEAAAYNRFRNRYQNNWRQYFDPIAGVLQVSPKSVAADLSVMPLIAASDYRELMDLTAGEALLADSVDPHPGTLFHWAMAINRESDTFRSIGSFASGMVPMLKADPLSWIGEGIGVYADDDPYWEEVLAAEDPEEFLSQEFGRMPVAFTVEVDQPLALAVFLTGLRTFMEQVAPGMTLWETRSHGEQSYVRIAPSADFADSMSSDDSMADLALYYVSQPGSLTFSLNESVIQHAIERRHPAAGEADAKPGAHPWLGKSLALRVDRKVLQYPLLWSMAQPQHAAWRSLPILNEWHARFPEQDPVAVHEELWHTRLICPGGGQYVWNEQDQTMESTVYGHPGRPLQGPAIPLGITDILSADFGLDLDPDGLRARFALFREARD